MELSDEAYAKLKEELKEEIRIDMSTRRHISAEAAQLFSPMRDKYAEKIHKAFKEVKKYGVSSFDILINIEKASLAAAGEKSAIQVYLNGKSKIANQFACAMCYVILEAQTRLTKVSEQNPKT